jgi:hypothetical protein
MRRISPYCQSKTPASAQSPVKIIQRNSGARSELETNLMSDETLITLVFLLPERHPRNAAAFLSFAEFNWAAGPSSFTVGLNLTRAKKSKSLAKAASGADW